MIGYIDSIVPEVGDILRSKEFNAARLAWNREEFPRCRLRSRNSGHAAHGGRQTDL